jgi:hypothetical protein
MKIWLETAIFRNRAPFGDLRLDLAENEIAILSAVNGRGKTTVLSHLVDAFYEIAKTHFPNEFEGRENKFYRISSSLHHVDMTAPSLVYFRFQICEDQADGSNPVSSALDYCYARGDLQERAYQDCVNLEGVIPFSEFESHLESNKLAKIFSSNLDKTKAEKLFDRNVLTYFPSYRFEVPGYLNDPYKLPLSFRKDSHFSGKMRNPLEVVSGLPQLANWLMDLVLDCQQYPQGGTLALKVSVDNLVTAALSAKVPGPLRLGVGPRGFGATRIQVVRSADSSQVYPTIFSLSSGEAALLCLFGEVVRQADNIINDCARDNITGIVLVDEIDKHLHIKMQKEVLPRLLALFPNVQFILSSHSPFLGMGLAEMVAGRAKIVDLDAIGVSRDPTSNALYAEVYDMMVSENERFREQHAALAEKIAEGNFPLIVTEGKTDVQHLRKAREALGRTAQEMDFFEITGDWGDSKLKLMLEQLSKVPQTRKVIGVFDRDVQKVVQEIESGGGSHKAYGNNVFGLCLPIPAGREAYANISIEFYYRDQDLLKEHEGKRIHFDNEVAYMQSASDGKNRTLIKLSDVDAAQEATKKVFDQDIGGYPWIHSKARFAELVERDTTFSTGFDFESFGAIFDRIAEITGSTAAETPPASESTGSLNL